MKLFTFTLGLRFPVKDMDHVFVFFGSRSFPAVCGGDVRAVASGFGCGGRVRGPPALHSVSRLPAVRQLRPLFHVRPCRRLLLPPGWSPLPPHRPNHPDSLPLMLIRRPWKQIGSLTCVECDSFPFHFFFITTPSMFMLLSFKINNISLSSG